MFLREAGLDEKIKDILSDLDTHDLENLRQRASQVRQAILSVELPEDLEAEIIDAYARLRGSDLHPPDVAVRSSATAEDLPDASFAGPAGDLFERAGSSSAAAHLQAMLCVALYRPGDFVSRRQRIRP